MADNNKPRIWIGNEHPFVVIDNKTKMCGEIDLDKDDSGMFFMFAKIISDLDATINELNEKVDRLESTVAKLTVCVGPKNLENIHVSTVGELAKMAKDHGLPPLNDR